MRIIVPIKQVPETKSVKMDEATGTVIREGVEAIVNPLDLYAVETALQLREQHSGEVIAISMGPDKAITALKEVISMGVDSAILISDRNFAGSDTWATSYIISESIKQLGDFSLVICGERATDGDTGQVGPGIAAFLDLPVISYVSKVVEVSKNNCTVNRLTEDGYEELSSSLPAVLTVVKEVSEPRLPTLRGKQKAKSAEIPVWNKEILEVDADQIGLKGSPTRVVKIFKPKVARNCQKIPASSEHLIEQAVDKLTEFLANRELI